MRVDNLFNSEARVNCIFFLNFNDKIPVVLFNPRFVFGKVLLADSFLKVFLPFLSHFAFYLVVQILDFQSLRWTYFQLDICKSWGGWRLWASFENRISDRADNQPTVWVRQLVVRLALIYQWSSWSSWGSSLIFKQSFRIRIQDLLSKAEATEAEKD